MDLLRFFLVDQRLRIKKMYFLDLFANFSKSIIKKKGGIIWKKKHNFSIISPKQKSNATSIIYATFTSIIYKGLAHEAK